MGVRIMGTGMVSTRRGRRSTGMGTVHTTKRKSIGMGTVNMTKRKITGMGTVNITKRKSTGMGTVNITKRRGISTSMETCTSTQTPGMRGTGLVRAFRQRFTPKIL
jgi:hypothetical protein